MAVKLIANYAKRLGLPGYSSHQFSVSVEVELRDAECVAQESERLYKLLQQSVDQQMQETGFVPPHEYGRTNGPQQNGQNTNGNHANGYGPQSNGNRPSGSRNGNTQYRHPANNGNGYGASDTWACTEGQRGFLLRVINENNVPKDDVEAMAQQLFGLGVKQCSKLQMSQLIADLLERCGKPQRSRWQNNRQPARS